MSQSAIDDKRENQLGKEGMMERDKIIVSTRVETVLFVSFLVRRLNLKRDHPIRRSLDSLHDFKVSVDARRP